MMPAGRAGGGGSVSAKQLMQSAAVKHWGIHTPMDVRIPTRKSKNPWTRKLVRSMMLTEIPLVLAGVGGATLPPPFPPFPPLFLDFLQTAGAICMSMRPITRESITTCWNFNMVPLELAVQAATVAWFCRLENESRACILLLIYPARNYPAIPSLTFGCYAKLPVFLSPKIHEGCVNRF